ncbi:pyroglutamyl-peptidase I [Variovorax soli]|uniref:pyroglutamyl-peptidase I n=1 Tax=Variovorax soli TaxID=376815 RepID=UPI0008391FCE|nr:pyroglutamyl-peptidase I [Variovorax soli]
MAGARVLVTGFEPFDRDSINPSWEAVRALDGWGFDLPDGRAVQVHARRMPCVFGAALQALDEAIDDVRPELVLAIGQAGGRSEVTPERVAINVDDGRICDNAGCQPIDLPVVEGAPAAYFSTLPIKALVRDMRAAGIPAAVSNSAGTFVCNHIFFGLMHRIATRPLPGVPGGLRGGFIHIPLLPEQAARLPGGLPSLSLDTVIEALRISVRTAMRVREDVRETGGTLN